ncbi:MAG: glycine cleavage system protein R [Gammaproteobacteria bacterium]
MTNYLVISAIGEDRPGTIDRLARAILEHNCSIEDSRMSVLGGSFAQILLVAGKWNNLAKLESTLSNLQDQLHLTITTRHTELREAPARVLSYTVDVVSLNQPGIVGKLSSFFASRGINIHDMATNAYRAAHTASPMFSVRMTVDVPAHVQISQLREDFLDLCDEENLDGVLEPLKL